MHAPEDRLLSRQEVEKIVGLSKTTIYRLMRTGDFPRPRQVVGVRCKKWLASDIMNYVRTLPRDEVA